MSAGPSQRQGAVPRQAGPGRLDARDPRRPFATSPFSRLARTHVAGVAGDALFAIGLAGSVFFSLDFDDARWQVALYLVLTIAPFAVAAPLIGPVIDRIKGGRRWMIIGSMAVRAVLCVLVIRHLDSFLFYPEAFLMLVLGKAYAISKSAIVPTTVRSDEALVEANSKLTLLSAVAVAIVAVPGGLLLSFGGPQWTLGLACVAFVVATAMAARLPKVAVAETPAGPAEREELRSAGILLAASAMGIVRGVVGFLAFMLAFSFKEAGAPLWHLGVAAAFAQLGFLGGAVAAPHLRRFVTEERIILGSLLAMAVAGFACALLGGLVGAALLSFIVGVNASAAKQAFDAIVQRDAPDANRGRSFARFETRFQLVWVLGALVPIVVTMPSEVGFLVVSVAATFGAVSSFVGQWRLGQGRIPVRREPLHRRIGGGVRLGRKGAGDEASSSSDTARPLGPSDPSDPSDSSDGVGEPVADGHSGGRPGVPGRSWTRSGATGRRASAEERTCVDPTDSWEPPPGFVSEPLTETHVGPEGVQGLPSVHSVLGSAPQQRRWPEIFDGADHFDEHPAAAGAVERSGEGIVAEGSGEDPSPRAD